jgi:hypothetical protein
VKGCRNWCNLPYEFSIGVGKMKIEERVIGAMQAGIEGNWPRGMDLICPAIEATARKRYQKGKVTREEFKNYVRENYPIIEAFIGAGLDLSGTVFPEIKINSDGGRVIQDPDFADVIYHAFRCSLAHGWEVADEFEFTVSPSQGISHWLIHAREGRIHMPDKTLWALIACVVFSEANSDISTETGLWLTWGGAPAAREPPYHFDLDVFWGGEQQVRRFLAKRNLIKVAMKKA